VRTRLSPVLICPSCECSRPIGQMSIDKRFTPMDEQHDSLAARTHGEAPSNSTWRIRCDTCDPQRGGYYWFPLDQCDTPAKALDCIMRLNATHPSPIVVQSFIDLMEYLFGSGAPSDE